MKCRAQIVKNRLGPPLRHADYIMYFESGIDDYGNWLEVLKEHKLIRQAGAWYTFDVIDEKTGEVKEELKFQSKDWAEKLEDEDLKKYVYNLICSKQVLEYSNKLGIDDVEFAKGEVIGDD